MLPEAELFVMAEQMLTEVLGRIRERDRDIVLPPMYAAADPHLPLGEAVARYARDDAALADVLAGRPPGATVHGADLPAIAAAACAAAQEVGADQVLHTRDGDLSAGDFLLRATIARSLLAHYVAAYLGSTACPLPEELARPLWELTAPEAERWRDLGYFREPMSLPEHVSWRDRFLLSAGHEPHPLGH